MTTSATIVAAGGTIQVGWTEKNEGAAASAPRHHTKISLSTGQYGTTHQIGYYFMNTLGQDNSQGYYDNIVIPTSIPPGDYYLTAFIDGDAEVAESDEDNNIGSSNPTKITVTGGNYTITTSSSPANGGTTTGGGTYPAGTSRTVSATANSGFTFVNWTENGNIISTSSSFNITLNRNWNLVANFSAISYTITTSSSPANGGITNGGGTYPAGSSRTVTANANSGYTFVNWTENGNVVSNSSSYTFALNSNRTLVANFTANAVIYTIATSSSPSNGGTTSGGGTFAAGSSRTVMANANGGFSFNNWTENGSVVSSSSSYTFTLNSNRTLVANFTANTVNYTISTSSSPSNGGTTSGGGTFAAGSSRTVTASANGGFSFNNWTENGNVVSSSSSYAFALNSNRTLVANFTANAVNYTIATSSSPSNGGTTSGGGTFAAGSSRTVMANANGGFSFNNWTENGSVVSSSSSYTFTLNSNRTLVANFTANTVNYTISTSSSPSNGGTTSGGGTFAAGSSRTVTASANSGFSFNSWTENGSVVTTSSSYTFTLTGNRSLAANFGPTDTINPPNVESLTATSIGTSSVILNGRVTNDGGAAVESYYFYYWADPNSPVGLDDSAISVTGNSFSARVDGLVPNTDYHFRAYAGNNSTVNLGAGPGWGFGAISSFHTNAPSSKETSSLGNISTRLNVGAGDNAMIGGFIITGAQPKEVIVRGIGPSLKAFGVQNALADPVIQVHGSSGELLATNDNWRDDDLDRVQHVIDSGLAPTSALEAAKWGILNPGAYTVVVRGKGDSTGVGLFEVYDLDQTVDSKLANISTRGFVGTGDSVMIGGTIITGGTPAKVLFRAIGPTLINFGVSNPLQDPTLELRNQQGGIVASNDNWNTSPDAAAISATKIQPQDNRESAILKSLPPGQYTTIVRGKNSSTGVAVVEAYQLQ